MMVLVLPPNESCRRRVSFESRYGMCLPLPATSADMTLPGWERGERGENRVAGWGRCESGCTEGGEREVDLGGFLKAHALGTRLALALGPGQVDQVQLPGLDLELYTAAKEKLGQLRSRQHPFPSSRPAPVSALVLVDR